MSQIFNIENVNKKNSHKFHEKNKNSQLLDYYGSISYSRGQCNILRCFILFFYPKRSSNFNSII